MPTSSENAVARQLIEATRRGLRQVGIDVRRARPEAEDTRQRDQFNALIHARNRSGSPAWTSHESDFIDFCLDRFRASNAQLLQDLFVLHYHGGKQGGFFVEFGATDGIELSNTALLEKTHGWNGILAEPARYWHDQLRVNRSCAISNDCVWHTTGDTLVFNETSERVLSTIDQFSSIDEHSSARESGERYEVRTVSLLDLLDQHKAPRVIDYLSVDTEGSELEILRAFDFGKYDVRAITVEHNFTPKREQIHALLTGHGFTRKFESLSQWDDWYVK